MSDIQDYDFGPQIYDLLLNWEKRYSMSLKRKKYIYNDNILGKICINMREKQPSLTFRSGHLTRECVNTTKNLT